MTLSCNPLRVMVARSPWKAEDVSQLGVTCIETPDGVTSEAWEEGRLDVLFSGCLPKCLLAQQA